MKKVFWGILLAMANLGALFSMLVSVALAALAVPEWVYVWINAAASLSVALGYLLIMQGAGELPGGNFDWAGKLAKILCAYTAAIVLLTAAGLMPGGTVGTILMWASSIGSFLTMYFCVLGVADLERSGHCYLWADKLRMLFTAWVLLGLVGSFITIAFVAEFAAYIALLVYFAKAARAYRGSGGWRVM